MLAENLKRNIPLYVGHGVIVLLEDGTSQKGELTYDRNQTGIMLGEEFYSFDGIKDVRYLGTVTDYHTKGNTATIDYAFRFAVEEDSELYKKLFYKEYICSVSCHLVLDGQKSRIVAEDVALEGYSIFLHEPSLLNKKFLYKVQGMWRTGTLVKPEGAVKPQIAFEDGTYVTGEEVEDITRRPKVNETVSVVTKQGDKYQGIVGVLNDTDWYIICYEEEGEIIYSERIVMCNLEEVRFQGVITNREPSNGNAAQYNNIDGIHAYKPQYIRNNSKGLFGNVLKNRKVSYRVGVNPSGLIAKEIDLADFEVRWKYGVVAKINGNFRDGDSVGAAYYVGSRIGMTEDNRGTMLALQSATSGEIDSVWGKKLSIVKYILEEGETIKKQGNSLRRIAWMEQVRCCEIDKCDYEIEVNEENGEVTKTTIYQRMADEAIWESYGGKEAEVQYSIVNEEGQKVSKKAYGVLSLDKTGDEEGNISQLVIESREGVESKTVVPLEAIERIWLYGIITAYNEDQGYIGKAYFHINDSIGMDGVVEAGTEVVYEVGISGKGNGFCAYNVAYRIRKRAVYIVAYENNQYTVVDAGNPNACELQTIYFTKNGYSNEYFDPGRMYLATVTYERKLGKEMVVSIVLEGSNKENIYRKGQIQMYNKNANYGFVVAWENRNIAQAERREKNLDKYFNGDLLKESVKATMNTYTYIYDVLYKCSETDGKVDKLVILASKDKKATFSGTNIPFGYREYVIPPVKGESIAYYKKDSKNIQLGIFNKVSEAGKLILDQDTVVDPEMDEVWRFGVVTGFDIENGKAYLNNKVRVDMSGSCMDETLVNMIKANKLAVLVSYVVKDRRVDRVTQISKDVLSQIEWEKGIVDEYVREGVEKCVKVVTKNSVNYTHYLTVFSDQMVNKKARTPKTFEKSSVFVKGLRVPDWRKLDESKSPVEIKMIAADIHCEQEELVIKFGENEELKAYRHEKDFGQNLIGSSKGVIDEVRRSYENSIDLVKTVKFKVNEEDRSAFVAYVVSSKGNKDVIGLNNADLIKFTNWSEGEKDKLTDRINKRLQGILEDESTVYYGEYTFILHTLLRNKEDVDRNLYRLLISSFPNMKKNFTLSESKEFNTQDMLRELFVNNARFNVVQFLRCVVALDNDMFERVTEKRDEWFQEDLIEKVYSVYEHNFVEIRTMFKYELQKKEWFAEFITNLRNHYKKCKEERLTWLKNYTYSGTFTELYDFFAGTGTSREVCPFGDKIFALLLDEADIDNLQKFMFMINEIKDDCHEDKMQGIFKQLKTWIEEVKTHPTQFVTEGLLANAIPGECSEEIDNRLRTSFLEKDIPNVSAGFMEGESVSKKQEFLTFYMQNVNDESNKALREAENVKVNIELYYMAEESKGVSIGSAEFSEGCLPQTRKDKQNLYVRRILVPDVWAHGGEYGAKVVVSYEYRVSYDKEEKETKVWENAYSFTVKDTNELGYMKGRDKFIGGRPYTTEEVLDSENKMFCGRKDYLAKLYDVLFEEIQTEEGTEVSAKKGTAIYVYGQKRCGKSSLISQLYTKEKCLWKKVLPTEEETTEVYEEETTEVYEEETTVAYVDKKTMVVEVDMLDLSPENVPYDLRQFIIWELAEIAKKRAESLEEESEEYTLLYNFGNDYNDGVYELDETGYAASFDRVVKKLHDNGYKVVVILDEFTSYCSWLLSNGKVKPGQIGLLKFLRDFKRIGITQIIIGHERMKEVMDEMGLTNAIIAKQKGRHINAMLKPKDGRDLIESPMCKILKYNPYSTPCGKQLVTYIAELSGMYPYFINLLCQHICDYMHKKDVQYISKIDLEEILADTILAKGVTTDEDYSDKFNSLKKEEDDSEQLQARIDQCLVRIVREKSGTIQKDVLLESLKEYSVDEDMEGNENLEAEAVYKRLIDREVIREYEDEVNGGAMVFIPVGIFKEYLRVENGITV